MKLLQILPLLAGILAVPVSRAVYAPIPEQEQGKDITYSATAGISHDSNIFGAPNNEISSTIYSFSPKIKFNSSVSDQTFLSASYKLTLDHFTDRPGDKTLDSHNLEARVAHAFSSATTLDVSDNYTISKNPESLLAGLPVNSNQSFKRNQLDGRFGTNLGQKMGGVLKARTVRYRYDNPVLGAGIDRTENLIGAELSFDYQPETKLVAEYRHQVVDYRSSGANKDKSSDFLIGGFDYTVARKLTASGRFGGEWRKRDGEGDTSAPFIELSTKYDYAERSYLTAGYAHTLEEASNVANFTDTKVNRFFVNVQHALTGLIVASGSLSYEPSTLQGRRGFNNVEEKTTRLGLAVSYLINHNWTASVTYDYDNVNSDDANREMKRERFGLSAGLSF